ncbi:beta-ketoacyl reductase, partial [Streptomyces sp. NPDC005438]|uniref:beta-ketoacyl reductase n=1 Tax=Streptomyces sp. NPDC005438 TaxID=3156880 RepID=UPI0033AAC71E
MVDLVGVDDPWPGLLVEELELRGAEVWRVSLGVGDLERGVLGERLGGFVGCGRVVSFVGQGEWGFGGGGVPVGVVGSVLLVQALLDVGFGGRLWWVTSGGVSVGGEVLGCPVRGGVWGLGRVVGLEEPGLWGGLVDVPVGVERGVVGRLVEVLVGGAGVEGELVVRGGGVVLGRRLVPVGWGGCGGSFVGEGGWVPSGVVLVTGGTGVLGGRVARWLLECGVEGVVLVSRSGLGGVGAVGLRDELVGLGLGWVEVVGVDVGVESEVRGVVEGFGVSGVVHCAGVLDDGVVEGLSVERVEGVWSGKAGAGWNLHRAVEGLELDAFVVFSSAAGVWGGAGQGSYAAANAALDALVEYRRGLGLPGLSVAWGPWAEGGMADSGVVRERVGRGGVVPLDPGVVVGLLGLLEGCVTVVDVDWGVFVPAVTAVRSNPLWERVVPEGVSGVRGVVEAGSGLGSGGLVERLRGVSGVEGRSLVVEVVRGLVASVLGFGSGGDVGLRVAFRDMGFDSLTAVELRNALA